MLCVLCVLGAGANASEMCDVYVCVRMNMGFNMVFDMNASVVVVYV